MIEASPSRVLPVWVVVQRSFSYAWESRFILGPPYAIYAAVSIIADLLIGYAASGHKAPLFVVTAVEEVFAMAFAVGIHRFVLMGEVQPGMRFFRWDRNFVQYLLTALALFLMGVMVFLVVLGMFGNPNSGGNGGLFGIVLLMASAGAIWAGIALSRMSLILPSAALGDHIPAKLIWEKTRQNGFRLFAATFLSVAPFLLVQLIMLSVFSSGGLTDVEITGAKRFLVIVASGIIAPLQLIVITTTLALSYDILVRGRGPVAGQV